MSNDGSKLRIKPSEMDIVNNVEATAPLKFVKKRRLKKKNE
jgi:hypothetical protein|tara:strand:- start:1750 stop:1872 length:123 start_codon:yes stop_codon:yes gene_type:complete